MVPAHDRWSVSGWVGYGQGMTRASLLGLLIFVSHAAFVQAESKFIEGCTGFPCANFSVGAEVTPAGDLFPRILFNPPKLGSWLEEWGGGQLAVEVAGKRWTAEDLDDKQVVRSWPQATVRWADKSLPVRLHLDAWAPVVAKDVASTALPVLVTRVRVDGPAGTTVTLIYTAKRQRAFAVERLRLIAELGHDAGERQHAIEIRAADVNAGKSEDVLPPVACACTLGRDAHH